MSIFLISYLLQGWDQKTVHVTSYWISLFYYWLLYVCLLAVFCLSNICMIHKHHMFTCCTSSQKVICDIFMRSLHWNNLTWLHPFQFKQCYLKKIKEEHIAIVIACNLQNQIPQIS